MKSYYIPLILDKKAAVDSIYGCFFRTSIILILAKSLHWLRLNHPIVL